MEEGLELVEQAETSDFHIINTCTFIQSATEETIETILDSAKIKKQNGQKLVVVGCFAQRYPDAISEELPEVDYFFGTGKYDKAGSILKTKFPEYFPGDVNANLLGRDAIPQTQTDKAFAYVKISDGCNRGCHFCIIPSLRGNFRENSREQILNDTRAAVQSGAKEICLVSQDTVFYQKNTEALIQLLEDISTVEDLQILRLLYLYPDKKTFRLLDAYKSNPKIAPYFESPVQHVSEKMLKKMNRSGSPTFFRELFAKARQVTGLEIRTSLILGYPGETAEDVDTILQFVEDVRPEKLALFRFSPQEGTHAETISQDVSAKEAARRVNLVRDLHLKILKEIHLERVGKEYTAILDEVAEDGSAIARRLQDAPEIDEVVYLKPGAYQKGAIGKVRIDSFAEYDMEGTWLG